VSKGQYIAQVDNTGAHSDGHHLHLQIVVNPECNAKLEGSPFVDSENRSRNPELWIEPYAYNSTQTATVIGKVTDASGNPVSGLQIHGLSKPAGATYGTYVWSETYPNTIWANPDDLWVENWATTDVAPGIYHLYARRPDGSLYKDLGEHTISAGKITYVGLYSSYLPDLKANYQGQTSSIIVRNNSVSEGAQVNTTFFLSNGAWGYRHRVDTIAPQSTLVFSPPTDSPNHSFYGIAVIYASQNISVIVRDQHNDEITTYSTLKAVGGALGWEQAGSTLYVPVVKNNYYARSTTLNVFNAGTAGTQVTVAYYRNNGEPRGSETFYLLPNGRRDFTSATYCDAGNSYYCAAVISNSASQPLAAIAQELNVNGLSPAAYNASSAAGSPNYAPVVKRDWYGQTSSLAVHNPNNAAVTVAISYYRRDSADMYGNGSSNIPAHGTTIFRVPDEAGQFIGSAVVQSTGGQPLVTTLYESGSNTYKSANTFLSGGPTSTVPEVNTTSGHTTGVTAQNVGSAASSVTILYYNANGALTQTYTYASLAPNRMHIFSVAGGDMPANFSGSAVVSSAQPLAVIVHRTAPGSGDTHATYNGSLP